MSEQERSACQKVWSAPVLMELDADLTSVAGGNGFACQTATLKNASVTFCAVS